MSTESLTWALAQRPDTPIDMMVLVALANYADANGMVYPRHADIIPDLAEATRASEQAVRESLETLVGQGLVAVTPGTPGRRTTYWLAMPAPAGLFPCAASGQCVRRVRTVGAYCCQACGDAWEAKPRYEPVHTEGCTSRQMVRGGPRG